jgi:hypothetical protein
VEEGGGGGGGGGGGVGSVGVDVDMLFPFSNFKIFTASKIIFRRQTETKFVSVMEDRETKYCRKICGVKFHKEKDTNATIQYVCTELHGLLSTFLQEGSEIFKITLCLHTNDVIIRMQILATKYFMWKTYHFFFLNSLGNSQMLFINTMDKGAFNSKPLYCLLVLLTKFDQEDLIPFKAQQ